MSTGAKIALGVLLALVLGTLAWPLGSGGKPPESPGPDNPELVMADPLAEAARRRNSSLVLTPPPQRVKHEVHDIPIKTMVAEDYIVANQPTSEDAAAFLNARLDELLATVGYRHHQHPTQVFLTLYASKADFDAQGGRWLAQIRYSAAGGLGRELDVSRLSDADVSAGEVMRYGLTLARRKAIYVRLMILVSASTDRALAVVVDRVNAEQDPARRANINVEKQTLELAQLLNEQGRSEIADHEGVSQDVLNQILLEGTEQKWPTR